MWNVTIGEQYISKSQNDFLEQSTCHDFRNVVLLALELKKNTAGGNSYWMVFSYSFQSAVYFNMDLSPTQRNNLNNTLTLNADN